MMIEKQIKISCMNIINKQKSFATGQKWRSWKIQIRPAEYDASASLDLYIDHVEYILHESFETPRITCKQEPFMIEQEGWGEFDLGIVFHFKDNLMNPQTIIFDLNFSKPKFSVYKSLEINQNVFYSLLQKRQQKYSSKKSIKSTTNTRKRSVKEKEQDYTAATGGNIRRNKSAMTTKRQRATSSATSSIVTSLSSSSSVVTTPTNNCGVGGGGGDHVLFCGDLPFGRSRSLSQQIIIDDSSFSDNNNNNNNNNTFSRNHEICWKNAIVIPEEIDIPKLASGLESLNDDNLRIVYNIILQYDTRNMLITETEDQVILDLYSLGNSLLSKLWEFIKSVQEAKQDDTASISITSSCNQERRSLYI